MNTGMIANVSATINAPSVNVWGALVNPDMIQQYMFGAHVMTDWKEGSPIVWKGDWQGKSYEDKGVVLKLEPNRKIQYSHFSPLTGLPDTPENYHIVTIELFDEGAQTRVVLTQDNNSSDQAREQSEKNWGMMLGGLKNLVEK
jgi:uncharacterized protein YndB with AHSA1/START domain